MEREFKPGTCERCLRHIKKAQDRIDVFEKVTDFTITWEGGGNGYNHQEFPFSQIKELILHDMRMWLECTCSKCIREQNEN